MNYAKHETDNFFVHTPEKVEFRMDSAKSYTLVVDGEFELALGAKDPVVGQLRLGVDENELLPDYKDGRYFIVDGSIIDHRTASNLKFEHDEESVKQLADKLGFSYRQRNNRHASGGRISTALVAHSQTEAFDCSITPDVGGAMDIKMGFGWSPFDLNIKAVIEMWRQICENGAIAQSPLLDCLIPMMNRWEENLAISNRVIHHNFDKIVLPRLNGLTTERVSLADVSQMNRIFGDLLGSKDLYSDQTKGLKHMAALTEKALEIPGASHLRPNQLKFIEAPMTAYDAYNMVTEAATHYVGKDRTTARSQAFISNLLFNDSRKRAKQVELDSLLIGSTTMANPDQAFWGHTHH